MRGAIKWQVIICAYVNPDLRRHMASLAHSQLTLKRDLQAHLRIELMDTSWVIANRLVQHSIFNDNPKLSLVVA